MTSASRKLRFALDIEDDWPPVSIEGVWCDPVGTGYRLRNAPFFIKGLAVNDIFTADQDPVNGLIFEFQVLEKSANSLVWILNNTKVAIDPTLAQLRSLGCSTEGMETLSLYAVDIPPQALGSELDALLDAAEQSGLDLAFPVWRGE